MGVSERKPQPRDFPVLMTMREAHDRNRLQQRYRLDGGYTVYQPCPCCGLAVQARNRGRHAQACMRRKRAAPELWAEWQSDMRSS